MNPEEKRRAAWALIEKERDYQRSRWTPDHDQQHTPQEWLTILTVYMGKAASELPPYTQRASKEIATVKKRLVQVAAIALAAVESME